LHFNTKSAWDKYSIPAPSFESGRLIAIDTLQVDNHSRLTLTKKMKEFLPILPHDKIAVFEDRYNKDLIFAVQREDKIIDNFLVRRKYGQKKNDTGVSPENREVASYTEKHELQSTLYDINILLVDDESDLLAVYEWFLESEGYRNIRTFTDSREVVKHLADLKNPAHYRLAIIDIRMPIINGIQLYQILKIFNPKIKVLFVSALDAADELTSTYQIAQQDILRKPCDRRNFVSTINSTALKISQIQ
jgi:CheY-like chemotaxis protein